MSQNPPNNSSLSDAHDFPPAKGSWFIPSDCLLARRGVRKRTLEVGRISSHRYVQVQCVYILYIYINYCI